MATNLNLVENYTSPLRTIGAKVELTDGTTTKTLTQSDSLKSAKIEKVGDQSKFFGYGISQKLTTVAVDKDKEININDTYCGKVSFKVGDGEYINASPDFHITDTSRDEVSGELTITAYDAIENAKGYTFADLGMVAPYTVRDVAEAVGSKIGAKGTHSTQFSPNLIKPLENWKLANGATLSGGYINLDAAANSQAYYELYWRNRTEPFYFQATTDSAEETYSVYITFTFFDKNNKQILRRVIEDSNLTGEHICTINSTEWLSDHKKHLRNTHRIRIYITRNATYAPVAYKVKNIIASTSDVSYVPYHSGECATRNLLQPFNQWILNNGAVIDGEYLDISAANNSSAYINVPWRCRGDKFYAKVITDSTEEAYNVYITFTFFDINGKQIMARAIQQLGISGEQLHELDSSNWLHDHKAHLRNTNTIRVSIQRYTSDRQPYKAKNFIVSENDADYVPYEGAPFALTYEAGANYEGTETLQEVLNDIAEATQTIYFINNKGTLFFKKLDIDGDPVAEIKKSMYFSLENKEAKRLCEIVSATELGDNLGASLAESGSTQFVRDNPFWDLREDRAQLVDNALAAVQGLTINQFTCSWRGFPFLEIGDKLAFKTKEDNTIFSYLLSDTLEYDGALAQKTDWNYIDNKNETSSNPTTLGEALNQTYAKVDKANKRIELVAKESEDKYAQLVITTDGIKSDVKDVEEQVETTKSELTEEIDGVKGELTTVKTTVSTQGTQIEQNKTDINLRATKEELTTVQTTLEGADAANKELIDANAISVQTIEKSVSELSVNAEGINASVQNLTTIIETNAEGVANEIAEINKKVDMSVSAEDVNIAIKTEMANGVNKVETSTGYKFDEEGLTVSKSNSEMETKITEDGMVVYKNGDAVLTANNQGVDAKNLHATTYLIIGKYSRFEDIPGEQRTGCFWVGGA